ncbi:hypothetical protein HMPREF1531_00031 [Propionibacterium sp. oral taxon 192 str. F0372]|nr:hypothetical protein HMPREF1531_00031 [Propionibacterium sp. oral taxon 192 str. F0372]
MGARPRFRLWFGLLRGLDLLEFDDVDESIVGAESRLLISRAVGAGDGGML